VPHTDAELVRAVRRIRGKADVVPGHYGVNLVPTDAKDNPIVAAALEGQAGYIVTDDRQDLLPLKVIRLAGHQIIQIVRPTDFMRHVLRLRR
jgi:predicted nucleic acid-binding protein